MSSILRSLLFVPGSRPERFEKALGAGADLVCIDLEDAVLPGDKDSARDAVLTCVQQTPTLCVRINPVGTQTGEKDLQAFANAPIAPEVVMLAKCESAEDVQHAQRVIGKGSTRFIPLIETLEGLENAYQIASASEQIEHIMFGGADMAAELRCEFSYQPLLFVRSQLVFAAAKANVGLIDVPYVDIKDEAALVDETNQVKALGFSGKAAIHPCQIPAIHQAFMPSAEQVVYAKDVMAAVDGPDAGVVVVNNKMVDRPIILACQRTLALVKNASSN
ncbi:Citrate lyase [Paraglaciecola sp. T6c]|uniref:HpcH/HpaI aldolase/citrate lyase family protein n=1 Tax=Pseudoalteromonas atlantica (strain T6c / ATCC BAA-1087) TaxID=3042615 RepID=UPI00005C627B|nr:CoA ester lyase [Paraglaciecola sp. T6c]ABG41229.1 Citrate lyase [Paraglaciecola sp. T6c]